jgi:hypothetical protein
LPGARSAMMWQKTQGPVGLTRAQPESRRSRRGGQRPSAVGRFGQQGVTISRRARRSPRRVTQLRTWTAISWPRRQARESFALPIRLRMSDATAAPGSRE